MMEWTNEYPTKPGYYWVYNKKVNVKFLEHFLWIIDKDKHKLIPTTMYENYYKAYNSNNEVYLYGPIEEPDTPYHTERWYPNKPETHQVIRVPNNITEEFANFVSHNLSKGYVLNKQMEYPNNYYVYDDYGDKYAEAPLKPGDYIVEEIDGYVRVYSESDFLNFYHKKE